MELSPRKRGQPRIPLTEDVLERRRLAKQRFNGHRFEATATRGHSMVMVSQPSLLPIRKRGGGRLMERRTSDGRFVNFLGVNDYEFVGLAVNEDLTKRRDILVQYKQRVLQPITELHPCFMSLQYPCLFPRREDEFQLGIKYCGANNVGKDNENTGSMREFQAFRL
ncbi:hypothetical protein AgCh_000996 [Apium graveolens]